MRWIDLPFKDCRTCKEECVSGSGPLQSHKKELAATLAGVFLLLAVMGFFCANTGDIQRAERWAHQPWVESFCRVVDTGVAYRGNCELGVTLVMNAYNRFTECLGPRDRGGDVDEAKRAWDHSTAGLCAARGNAAYSGGRADFDLQTYDSPKLVRRLQDPYPPGRLVCHNSFLVWAVVRLPNSTAHRCAYNFGAAEPSVTGDWSKVLQTLAHLAERGSNSVCWVLNDCIVALHDQQVLAMRKAGEQGMIRVHALLFTALAALCAAAAAYWHCCAGAAAAAYGHFLGQSSSEFIALPTEEPEECSPCLDEHVHEIVREAALRLSDATPPASGASTLRGSGAEQSPRTVEVVLPNGNRTAVPQNIAADFVMAAS